MCKEVLGKDPLHFRMHDDIVASLKFAGKSKEADTYLASTKGIDFLRILGLVQHGEIDKAFRVADEFGSNFAVRYPGTMALLLEKTGKRIEAEVMFSKAKERDAQDLLWATNELYGRAQANREAARLDKKLVIDFPLLTSYIWFPNQLPFDLSATPNFARRLKQAGVINK